MNAQARRTAVATLLFNSAGVLEVLPLLGVARAHLLFNGAAAALSLLYLSPRMLGGWVDRR